MTSTLATAAQGGIDYEAGVTVNAGSSHLAPYYIASNRGGTLTQQYGTLAFASAVHELDTARRVSWGFGAEAWAGYSSSADYDRYSVAGDLFYNNSQHPARLWVQQLYIEGKYRSVRATLGAKTLTASGEPSPVERRHGDERQRAPGRRRQRGLCRLPARALHPRLAPAVRAGGLLAHGRQPVAQAPLQLLQQLLDHRHVVQLQVCPLPHPPRPARGGDLRHAGRLPVWRHPGEI